MKKRLKHFGIGVIIILLIVFGISTYYLLSYTPSTVSVQDYGELNAQIHLSEEENGIYIDNLTSDTLLVFYPGAKIEVSSYVPLLYGISENGFDCFIVKMPFNLAVFDMDAYDKIYNTYHPNYAFLMGHSLGGAMAARYISEKSSTVDGLILLAAYSDKDISDSGIPVLSIYGSLDGVLNIEEYGKDRGNLPEDFQEVVIEGGNHAGFGNYGLQNGDNEAQIPQAEQQEITENAVVEFMQKIVQKKEKS